MDLVGQIIKSYRGIFYVGQNVTIEIHLEIVTTKENNKLFSKSKCRSDGLKLKQRENEVLGIEITVC